MSNPLSALAGVASPVAGSPPAASALGGNAVNASALAESGGPSGAGEAFQSMLNAFHSEASGYEAPGGPSLNSDPVAAAKTEFTSADKDGASVTLAPTKPGDAANGLGQHDGGLTVLQKSFDHAIFVTLVSQIVSGVSQATTTLVRQQ